MKYNNNEINPLNHRPYSERYFKLLEQRKKLPVYEFLDDLVDNVRKFQTLIVEGETGSGKTTQIPGVYNIFIYRHYYFMILELIKIN